REFYKEKEVVREERRMRTESQPFGRLLEEFTAVAYTAHPYGRPVVGWNSDITATTMEDAREFYENITCPTILPLLLRVMLIPMKPRKWRKHILQTSRLLPGHRRFIPRNPSSVASGVLLLKDNHSPSC